MTFLERYQSEPTWHGRVYIMEIYHLTMTHRQKWTVTQTAEYFNCSIGLVSENLKLGHAIHANEKLLACQSRQEALKRLNGNGSYMAT